MAVIFKKGGAVSVPDNPFNKRNFNYRQGSRGGGYGQQDQTATTNLPQSTPEPIPVGNTNIVVTGTPTERTQVKQDVQAFQRSEQIKQQAQANNTGYTRLQTERKMGGAEGIVKLRQATQRDTSRVNQGGTSLKTLVVQQSNSQPAVMQGNESTQVLSSLDVPAVMSQSKQEIDAVSGFKGVYDFVNNAQSYPELASNLYSSSPNWFKGGVNKVITGTEFIFNYPIQEFKRNAIITLGLAGSKATDISLSKLYETSPLVIPEAQFLALGFMSNPTKAIGNQEIKYTIPLRETRQPIAVEEITSEVNMGKVIRSSDYTIFTEKAPPRVSYSTSINAEAMGKAPKNAKFLPEVVARTRTPFLATNEQPFISLETTGGRVGKLSEVSGNSVELNIVNYKNLPLQDQFLVKRLAEFKIGGVPVSNKNIFNILNRDDLRFISDINVEKLGKIKIGKGNNPSYLEPLQPRKIGTQATYTKDYMPIGTEEPIYSVPQKNTIFRTISETKPLQVPKGMEDVFEFSKTEILFKDVTKPFSRATGKTPRLTVYTKEYLEPRIVTEESPHFISPATIEKTPLSKTFQIQKQVPKTLVKVIPPKVYGATITTRTISSPFQKPIYSSSFVGTGLYERTEGEQTPYVSFNYRTENRNSLVLPSRVVSEPKINMKNISYVIEKNVQKEENKSINKNINKLVPKEITKEVQKEIQKPVQKLTPKLTQKLIQKPVQKITPFNFGINPPRNRDTQSRIPNLKYSSGFNTSSRNFLVSVRRFGTFRPIGRTTSQSEAFRLGKTNTWTTLGATFKVQGVGVNQPRSIAGYNTKYTKQGTLFIQKPKYRLSTASEKSEINMFRRMKGGRKK